MKSKQILTVLVAMVLCAVECFAANYSLNQAILPNADIIITAGSTKGTVIEKFSKRMDQILKAIPGAEKALQNGGCDTSLDVQVYASADLDSISALTPDFSSFQWICGVYCENTSLRPLLEKNLADLDKEFVTVKKTATAGLDGWSITVSVENDGKKTQYPYFVVISPDGKYIFAGQRSALEACVGKDIAPNPLMLCAKAVALPCSQYNMILTIPQSAKKDILTMDINKEIKDVLTNLNKIHLSTLFLEKSIKYKFDAEFTTAEIAIATKKKYLEPLAKGAPLMGPMLLDGQNLDLFNTVEAYQSMTHCGITMEASEGDLKIVGRYILKKLLETMAAEAEEKADAAEKAESKGK